MGGGAKLSKGGTKYRCLKTVNLGIYREIPICAGFRLGRVFNGQNLNS